MPTNKNIYKQAQIGGSLEQALTGKKKLNSLEVLKNAALLTNKNFVSFFPMVFLLLIAQVVIAWISLKLQLGEPAILIQALTGQIPMTNAIVSAIQISNLSSDILSVPLYASVYLIAISNAIGLKHDIKNLLRGFYFILPLTITAICISFLQMVSNMVFFLLGLYVSLLLSFAIPLVCEKRLPVKFALLYSVKAVNRKIFPLIQVHLILLILFIGVVMMMAMGSGWMGLALLWLFPFYFHVKAVLYREIFGVTLIITDIQTTDENEKSIPDVNQIKDTEDVSDKDDNKDDTFSA